MSVGSVIIAILVFSVLIFVHELGHFIACKVSGVQVNEFALGMGPAIFKKQKGETLYALRLFPIGGYCAMEGEDEDNYNPGSFNNATLGRRFLILVSGSLMNLLLGLIIIAGLILQQPALGTTTVREFGEESLSHSHLQVGDEILKVNGIRVRTNSDLSYAFSRSRDGIMDMQIRRDGEKMELTGVPFQVYDLGEGIEAVYRDFRVVLEPPTFTGVVRHTISGTSSYIKQVWGTLIDLVTGRYNLKVLSGPVGVTAAIGQASTQGFDWLLNIVALITINLGVFNLLPLPALDGGRLLFLIIEGVRRKPMNPKYEGMVHAVGFALLLCLVIFATFNDIGRLFQ